MAVFYVADLKVLSVNLLVSNTGTITFTRGNKFFELSNHLGNVLATISDKKIPVSGNGTLVDWYMADVVTANDYYPGGMAVPGRKYSAGNAKYRYGFNGKENDNDVKGVGNHVDYGWRVYDPRLVRFLSVDPLQADYPELTPYQFAGNTPIQAVDLDGREIYHYTLFFPSDGRSPILTYLGEQKNKPCSWLCDQIDKGQWDGFKTYQGDEITDISIQVHVIAVEGYKSAHRPAEATVTFGDLIEAWKWCKAGYPGTEDEIAFANGFMQKLEGGTFVATVTQPAPSPARQSVAPRQSPKTNTAKQATAVNGKQQLSKSALTKVKAGETPENPSLPNAGSPILLKPEARYLGSGKHGISWKEGFAMAKKDNLPQGQWSKADLDFAATKASTLEPRQGAYFQLPSGSTSKVYMPDGSVHSATHIWVRNNGTGTFHGYPLIQ